MNKKFLIILLIGLCFTAGLYASEDEEIPPPKKSITGDPYLGERFHSKTKLSSEEQIVTPLPQLSRGVGPYKAYPDAAKIKLPQPRYKGLILEEVLQKRRSLRSEDEFSPEPLSIEELSELLFAANGVTGQLKDIGVNLRTAPSAGALYPIEIYLVVNRATGLEQGFYHYSVLDHSLELLKKGDFQEEITSACAGQEEARNAAVVFVFTAIPARSTQKYDVRGYRYLYLETGYISQNIYLEATSLGLISTAMGAFYDDELSKFLGIDGRKEIPIHTHVVGKSIGSKEKE